MATFRISHWELHFSCSTILKKRCGWYPTSPAYTLSLAFVYFPKNIFINQSWLLWFPSRPLSPPPSLTTHNGPPLLGFPNRSGDHMAGWVILYFTVAIGNKLQYLTGNSGAFGHVGPLDYGWGTEICHDEARPKYTVSPPAARWLEFKA